MAVANQAGDRFAARAMFRLCSDFEGTGANQGSTFSFDIAPAVSRGMLRFPRWSQATAAPPTSVSELLTN